MEKVRDEPKDKIVGLLNETHQPANLDTSDQINKRAVTNADPDNTSHCDIKVIGINKNNDISRQ